MDLSDRTAVRPVRSRDVVFEGRVWNVVRDVVDLGAAGEVTRDYIEHPGAVAVIALDEADRIVLVHQYRHPAGVVEWEIPAGLRDVDGEDPVATAARELAEEAFVSADEWYRLAEVVTTPGSSSETITVFLARGLREIPPEERHVRDGEELDMPIAWFPLQTVRDAILTGRLRNATLTIAVLAACAARDAGWRTLDPVRGARA
ncbi:NUDIX domain-containing protein [Nostocoides sp. F2B08]|uniref:NUDIX domain-containing protein n=1 Tax=Nostocoides sp. F2B08 TaxID=2653936 RepID=UPI00126301E4|nr:NUDIX hydrolase [Tetrasphaera sp. F2B08]KAB7744621.1 NUDIX domain-containing protein [Tetrasphaera sp. F2B08]